MAKSVLLIGLGRFGYHMAETMKELKDEILGVDISEERVEQCLPHLNASILQHFLNTVNVILIHMGDEKIIDLVHSSCFQKWYNPIGSYI